MSGSRVQPPAAGAAVEVDAKVVRGEAIRAVRGSRARSDLPEQVRPDPPPLHALVRVLRDLELTLAAISHSLAESVDHAAKGPTPPP